jgi:6-pyruvoyltetrahydropterin/6-carboxytetrahydropterin synthase
MLSRTVRFSINPDGSQEGPNGYAARPAMRGLGRYYELTATVRGTPDPQTGYIIGIQDIDAPLRASVIPAIDHACLFHPNTEPAALLPRLWEIAADALPRPLERLTWTLTPTYKVEMSVTDRPPSSPTPRVLVRQRFDFAAAHRLHSPHLSDEQNRATFGKCNNPSGHGHNYQIEPVVAVPVGLTDGFSLAALEQVVEDAVIEPFDHKHLNTDTPDFDPSRGGVIPSVENIAMVCHRRLAGAVRSLGEGVELVSVTVWETDRTSCTFPA